MALLLSVSLAHLNRQPMDRSNHSTDQARAQDPSLDPEQPQAQALGLKEELP